MLSELERAPGSGLVAGEVAFLVGVPGPEIEAVCAALVARGAAFRTRSALTDLVRYHPACAQPLWPDDIVVLDA